MKWLETKLWKGIIFNLVILILISVQSCDQQDIVSLPLIHVKEIVGVTKGIHRSMDWQRRGKD